MVPTGCSLVGAFNRHNGAMVAAWASSHPQGTVISVWVVPGSSRSALSGLHGDALRVRVAAPAEKGKANRAVCRMLEERLGCSVRLLSGSASRAKRLLAEGVDPQRVAELLSG